MSDVRMVGLSGGMGAGTLTVPDGLFLGGGLAMNTGTHGDNEAGGGSGDEMGVALAARVVGGDGDAFRELVEAFKMRVLGTAKRFVRNHHELDDLVQEIFLRVWKGLKTFRGEAPLEHWVMRVSVRTCYDHLRKQRRVRESEVLVEEPRGEAGMEVNEDRDRLRREAWEVVRCGLERLGEKDRVVITLLDLEGRSVANIAELTGWSESNVKVRAFRARKKLKTVLESLDGEK
ncbi:MAG: RNA polymerase sigma factor [Verrucomicrobiota bacterium]